MFLRLFLFSLLVLQNHAAIRCHTCGRGTDGGVLCNAGTPAPLKPCAEGQAMCNATWTGEVLIEKKCGDDQTEENLKADGYVAHDQNYLCKKESTTTNCFCTGTGCNDEDQEPMVMPNPRPRSTSGASSTVAGVFSMAGLILLARGV